MPIRFQADARPPVGTGGQPAAIVVSQAQPPGPKLAPQGPVFLEQVGDRLSLRRSSQPVSAPSTICSAAGSITGSSLYHRLLRQTSDK